MLIFGHLGLTLGVARALSREVDVRWVAVAALLPDLLDKPLRVLAPFFTQGNTRTVGHSLTVMLLGMVLVAFLCAASSAGHGSSRWYCPCISSWTACGSRVCG